MNRDRWTWTLAAICFLGVPSCGGTDEEAPPGRTPVVVATGQHGPTAIAIDIDGIYWANDGDGSIMAMLGGAAKPAAIATGEAHPRAIAVDEQNIFWVDGGTNDDGLVRKIAKAGGQIIDLAPNQDGPRGIALDESCVYWTVTDATGSKGSVMSIWKDVGELAPVATDQSTPVDVAFDLSGIYWANAGDGGGIMHVRQLGDAPELVAAGLPSRLALGSDRVFWADAAGVMSAPKDGGAAALVAADGANVLALVIDATYVYWASGDSVHRAPLAGGAAETFASALGAPSGLAVGPDALYVIDAGSSADSGRILKLVP